MGNTHSYLKMNYLHQGDNLTTLRNMPDASVDLICTDPPFNTGKDWGAFSDKWEGGLKGYLKFMEVRAVEMRRVLKDTGSLYLHCDPTASHYLKVMLDGVFGIKQFRNEIVWKRRADKHNCATKRYARLHDVILFYSKTLSSMHNVQYTEYDAGYLKRQYRYCDEKGRYGLFPCAMNNPTKGKKYTFRGITRIWLHSSETMEMMYQKGLLVPSSKDGTFRRKKYLSDAKGVPLDDLWIDINGARGNQSVNYSTQKPVALYERMIKASSNQGDTVLDPFAGSGTTLDAAHTLGRHWIGIDIGDAAIETIQDRLRTRHGLEYDRDYEIIRTL